MARDGEGLDEGSFLHLQGTKASKCGHAGSCRKAPGWRELGTAAGKHAGPATSSLSRKQREGIQCSSSPPLCPTAILAPNVLTGGTAAKFSSFSRSQERRGRWVGRGKKLTCKQLGEGRQLMQEVRRVGYSGEGVLTYPGHRGVVGSLRARA